MQHRWILTNPTKVSSFCCTPSRSTVKDTDASREAAAGHGPPTRDKSGTCQRDEQRRLSLVERLSSFPSEARRSVHSSPEGCVIAWRTNLIRVSLTHPVQPPLSLTSSRLGQLNGNRVVVVEEVVHDGSPVQGDGAFNLFRDVILYVYSDPVSLEPKRRVESKHVWLLLACVRLLLSAVGCSSSVSRLGF